MKNSSLKSKHQRVILQGALMGGIAIGLNIAIFVEVLHSKLSQTGDVRNALLSSLWALATIPVILLVVFLGTSFQPKEDPGEEG